MKKGHLLLVLVLVLLLMRANTFRKSEATLRFLLGQFHEDL